MKHRFWIPFAAAIGGASAFFLLLDHKAEQGRSQDGRGRPVWATVVSRGAGHCWVGVKHRQCWALGLRLEEPGGTPREVQLTLNIEDHLSPQVIPGRRVLVRVVDEETLLDVPSLQSGAAPP